MKKDIHPDDYRQVVFQDVNTGNSFLTRSTVQTEETIKWEDGNTYPLFKVHISSYSHPFYSGKEKLVDVEGRVDRFRAKMEAAKAHKQKKTKKTVKKTKTEAVKLGSEQAKSKSS